MKISSFVFRVIARDPYHTNCMPVYIALLIELSKTAGKYIRSLGIVTPCPGIRSCGRRTFTIYELNRDFSFYCFAELFKVSHRLINVMPESALPWYAVGSYYFLIGELIIYYLGHNTLFSWQFS
jgi:hypothetical protein